MAKVRKRRSNRNLRSRFEALLRSNFYQKKHSIGGRSSLEHFCSEGVFHDLDPNPLFDGGWYRSTYKVDPSIPALIHYLSMGAAQGNDPSAVFDTKYYLGQVGVLPNSVTPLEHYLSDGWKQGADTHRLFSTAWYIDHLDGEDLVGFTPIEHYLAIGWRDGKSPCSVFSVGSYLRRYPDVALADVEPLSHFLKHGHREFRRGSDFMDPAWYEAEHRDDPSVEIVGSLAHYLHVNSTIGLNWSDDPLANRIGEHLTAAQRRSLLSLTSSPDSDMVLRTDWDSRVASLQVPSSVDSRVSVVIPTFNHSEYLIRCLESIESAGDSTTFEIIVVDDGSDQMHSDRFAAINGIKLITQSNMGFAGACEAGVAASNAELLLLLNNDTEVLPGWLDGLVNEMDRHPETGAAGSMIISGNHLLQEAGAIIFSDGSGMQYGWGDSPLKWTYRSRREVDYCSGASLMIRRELWDRIGGFDDRFAPAYYEDTDLCFAARQAGSKVVYCPNSVIFHNEGSSAGGDGTGSKRFQFRNRDLFVEKWKLVLNAQPVQLHDGYENRLSELFRDSERRGAHHVLIVDHRVPTADRDSGSVRMTRILEALADQGRTVHFLPLDGQRMQPYSDALADRGIDIIGARPGDSDVNALISGLSGRLEMVMVSRPEVAAHTMSTILTLASGVPLVYDMVDAHGARVRKAGQVHGQPELTAQALQYEHLEAAVARLADVVVAVSKDDESYIEQVARIPLRTIRIPNSHSRADTAGGFATRSDLLFVGGYEHQPNVDAALFLVHEVLPLLLAELPSIRVVLVGSNPPPEVTALRGPNVIAPGWVADLDPVYAEARVVVAPLRYGAGVKGKIGEALSHGVPIVTTSVGVEGMSMTDGRDALIGESPSELAAAIVRVYKDEELWVSLRQNGLALVDELFGEGATRERVMSLLAAVAQSAEY